MKVSVYTVRGTDELVGVATNRHQLNDLCRYALHRCSTGVSLHGTLDGTQDVSGEFTSQTLEELLDSLGKRVWVVMTHIAYESDFMHGVYDSFEKAKAVADAEEKEHWDKVSIGSWYIN